jgi:Ca2+-binding EF-hand superfamily protein
MIMKTQKQRTAIAMACALVLGALPTAWANNEGAAKSDKHFAMMDTNGDGKISRAEHAAGAKKMFTECDANKDGIVTAAEMDASMKNKGEMAMKDDKTSAEKIKEIDTDNDGKLTATEHDAGVEKMFGKMDTDGDGSLSKAECDAGMKLMKRGT